MVSCLQAIVKKGSTAEMEEKLGVYGEELRQTEEQYDLVDAEAESLRSKAYADYGVDTEEK